MWNRIYPGLKKINKVRYLINQAFGRFYYARYFKLHGFPWGDDWTIYGKPVLRTYPRANIKIGHRFMLTSDVINNPIGVIQPVVLRVEAGAQLQIGNDVGISGSSISVAQQIVIGSEVLIGSGVIIVDNDLHQLDPVGRRYSLENITAKPVFIGDRVFIGTRSIVLKGVTIGAGSVIGAGSIVTSDIPPMSIAAGNPAKVIRKLQDPLETI